MIKRLKKKLANYNYRLALEKSVTSGLGSAEYEQLKRLAKAAQHPHSWGHGR